MEVGDVVFNGWQGFRRYGVIAQVELENSWKYCVVDWINDDLYEDYVKYVESLRNTDGFERKRYRIDELVRINTKQELATLQAAQNLAKNN